MPWLAVKNDNLIVIALPALHDNYIWLLHDGVSAIVVDPGDASIVLAYLAQFDLRLCGMLITHWHADHVGGIAELAQIYSEAVVYGPLAESITGVTQPLSGGEVLSLFFGEMSVISLSGHTRGHLGYLIPGRLFCGDTLFGLGCGRLFEGTASQMMTSLQKISDLPSNTLIYCAHEYTAINLPFALAVEPGNMDLQARAITLQTQSSHQLPSVPLRLAEEKATNPFLRCHIRAVISAAQQSSSFLPQLNDPVEVFAALRAWRNRF